MRRFGIIGLGLLLLTLTACEGTSFQSSVPAYPVHAEIDVERLFVDFTPENIGAYITVDKDGYKKKGTFVIPTPATDAWGYGGVLVYVSMVNDNNPYLSYDAYDLACPYCASRGKKSPCTIDGMYAVCPECGEQYDVGGGYAIPCKGKINETLRRLNILPSGKKLTITQR